MQEYTDVVGHIHEEKSMAVLFGPCREGTDAIWLVQSDVRIEMIDRKVPTHVTVSMPADVAAIWEGEA